MRRSVLLVDILIKTYGEKMTEIYRVLTIAEKNLAIDVFWKHHRYGNWKKL